VSEPANSSAAESVYVSALVAYDGTGFHGFQYQAKAASVQRELEAALDQVAERTSRIVGAGRTDAGVHASGQVIAVSVRWKHSLAALQRAWNVHLPPTVTVRRVQAAERGFHPRFSALSRTYRYVVWQYDAESRYIAPFRSPLTDRYSLLVGKLPALAAMQEAAGLFVGSHDFATFGQAMRDETTVRVVHTAEWRQVEETLPTLGDYPGRRLVFTITANAFLRRMVRSMVATLLTVGRGEIAAGQHRRPRRKD
jgi:tRNA pseudouridine38-40 synthase